MADIYASKNRCIFSKCSSNAENIQNKKKRKRKIKKPPVSGLKPHTSVLIFPVLEFQSIIHLINIHTTEGLDIEEAVCFVPSMIIIWWKLPLAVFSDTICSSITFPSPSQLFRWLVTLWNCRLTTLKDWLFCVFFIELAFYVCVCERRFSQQLNITRKIANIF